jgi:hypothetical protein
MKKHTFSKKLIAGMLACSVTVSMVPVAAMAAQNEPLNGITYTYAAENRYKYVYAALSWGEYWESEGVYEASNTASSDELDAKGELDKGGFDAVSRATVNHGLHRGSFQCTAVIYDTEGNSYAVSSWSEDGTQIYLTDGSTIGFEKGTITKADGSVTQMSEYTVNGIKYVPVKVAEADYEEFCKQYTVVENAGTLTGGYSEMNLQSYCVTAAVNEQTNGLKTAVKNSDGTFSFSARSTGTDSGIQDTKLKTVDGVEYTVKPGDGVYGEFLRVDLTGNYGDLGANMQAVKWNYYGNDATRTNLLASYGTKFAADNWMHKANGIQLGLTDSIRCQLPDGTDGTGYWSLTVYALGYEDYTIEFEATNENIVKAKEAPVVFTDLTAAIAAAKELNKADYTEKSWADMQTELSEAETAVLTATTQAVVDEALAHLTEAVNNLEKVPEETTQPQAQTITAKKSRVTYKAAALKKTKKSFSIGAKANTALSYKVQSGKKYISVSKNGTVTVKKNAKKGTYQILVTAKGSAAYQKATLTVKITVK